jgi:NADPH-dependent 2,4-dienoyl-CoA reductase/sulfur reductase-like enzyme
MSRRLLIVGGSDAGIQAALRARELDEDVGISVLLADKYPNFSICGLPYWLGGDVADWRSLAHRTRDDLEAAGIGLHLQTTAIAVDPGAHIVTARDGARRDLELTYDQLVLATGAEPVLPALPGLDLPSVHLLHTMQHAFALNEVLETRRAESAVIVGAGYIGLEMAEALAHRGLRVTVLEQLDQVLPTVDRPLATLVAAELDSHDVVVHTNTRVTALEDAAGRLAVHTDPPLSLGADVVLVSVGVRPSSELAARAGAALGARDAVAVDGHMATNLSDVWAAGDCAQTDHLLLAEPTYLPLGTTAHKQGRVAGENAIGGQRTFAGSLGTQVVKVFDLAIGRTGLRDVEARDAGYDPLTVAAAAPDHKPYYPGAHELQMRITGDRSTGRLLGCQLAGHRSAEVAKRIDMPATAISAGLTVDQLNDLDLSYSPPFGTPWDALQIGGQTWVGATT